MKLHLSSTVYSYRLVVKNEQLIVCVQADFCQIRSHNYDDINKYLICMNMIDFLALVTPTQTHSHNMYIVYPNSSAISWHSSKSKAKLRMWVTKVLHE